MVSIAFPFNKNHFESQLSPNKSWDSLTIKTEVPVKQAFNLLKESWFLPKIFTCKCAIRLDLNIDGDLEISEIYDTTNKILFNRKHAIMIVFISMRYQETFIVWKTSDSTVYGTFLSVKNVIMEEVLHFVSCFVMDQIKEGRTGIQSYLSNAHIDYKNVDLKALADVNGHNLLMISAERGREKIVEYLLSLNFDVDYAVYSEKGTMLFAVDFVYQRKPFNNDKIILQLLQANSQFPKNFNSINESQALNNFLILCNDVHKLINQNNIEKIHSIILKYPHIKYFYNINNKSAPYYALETGRTDIYNLFLEKGVYLSQFEDIPECLSSGIKEELRYTHKQFSKDIINKHLDILNAKSYISPDHEEQDIHYRIYISEMYEYLNSIPLISFLLQCIAVSKYFKIIFDFKRQSTVYLDPSSSLFNRGLFYTDRTIYIAAKDMLDSSKKYKVYGTVAQEFCHYAMFLLFKNDCEPYCKFDTANEEKFETINKKCEKIINQQMIDDESSIKGMQLIQNVYKNYPNDVQHAELIARVPHLYAECLNDFDFPIITDEFGDLFKFYKQVITQKIEKSIKALQKLENKSSEVGWNDLTVDWQMIITNSAVNFQGYKTMLLPSNYTAYRSLSSNQIRSALKGVPLKIGCELANLKRYVKRKLNSNGLKIEFSDLCDKKLPLIFLVNEPWEGKSIYFKYAAGELKKKFSQKWIQVIQCNEFILDLNITKNILSLLNVIKSLTRELDIFESSVFSYLFRKNNIILFWDNIEYVNLKKRNLILSIIKIIREQSENQQWVSCTPTFQVQLKTLFDGFYVSMDSFEANEIDSYVKKFGNENSINYYKSLLC